MKFIIMLSIIIPIFLMCTCSFQISIFNEMNKLKKNENLIISPFSIFQLLSLTTNGAKGTTQEEMLETLQSENVTELNEINYSLLNLFKKFTTVEVANSIMSKFEPLSSFSVIAEKYEAPIEKLESAEQVNNWCNEKTHGKIPKIIEELDNDILMVLLNAVYFKGEWIHKFNNRSTELKTFYNFGKNEIQVNTMFQISHFRYYEDLNIQVVELPFESDEMSALIILPKSNIDINNYINKIWNLENNDIKTIIKNLSYSKVKLELPKFELDFGLKLNEALKNLGIFTAFMDYADFSGLKKDGKIKIDEVIHKTYLKVFEEGTEAAAVTYGGMSGSSAPVEEVIYEMKINRPFLFFLRSNMLPEDYDLLFMSKIEELK